MNRRKAREYAFILLFEYRFQPDVINDIIEDFFAENDAGKQEEYIRDVVFGAISHIEEIDAVIAENSKAWSPDRISNVCMAVMRLAVYEMKYVDSIPPNVSINEGVSLAVEYDGEESAPFVNGVLDKIKFQIK